MTHGRPSKATPSVGGDEARRREMLQDLRETCRALLDARWALTVDIASVKAIGIALAKRRFTPDEAEAMIARTWPEIAEEEEDEAPLSTPSSCAGPTRASPSGECGVRSPGQARG